MIKTWLPGNVGPLTSRFATRPPCLGSLSFTESCSVSPPRERRPMGSTYPDHPQVAGNRLTGICEERGWARNYRRRCGRNLERSWKRFSLRSCRLYRLFPPIQFSALLQTQPYSDVFGPPPSKVGLFVPTLFGPYAPLLTPPIVFASTSVFAVVWCELC